ncbi:MAG: hypothetical protein A2722_04220 [Candidatus Doudnabacteria bacterium RIFCSPHIGHO2_01_FULL_50_11]|uniref:Uncharacterized protein n=1 Tax=Candidatus Doudnabacteria bacterium RIFCSPHIGHO2_01_FULL_50_11 TaxID=1817828 RepID=A0A1F5PGA4_9BACT|nr:MAG: hypothetical protein A2722_04220 [Candidatus Doudnabacteria bacterium RIFCSPHIGHO2_01_FULL_50_11]
MNTGFSLESLNSQYVVNTLFHGFMIFISVYSALIVFALTKFGRSKLLGLLVSFVYILLVMSLYLRAASLIAKL